MVEWLSNALVAAIVIAALCYAIYKFAPAKLRTWVLTQVGRVFGVRVLAFVLRHSSRGCGECGDARHPLAKKTIKPVR